MAVDSLSLRATPVFLTANPSIRTFAEAGTLVFLRRGAVIEEWSTRFFSEISTPKTTVCVWLDQYQTHTALRCDTSPTPARVGWMGSRRSSVRSRST
eukprot:COSAG02_NODE_1972_length_10217_cov_140.461653_10_plen_97_part_00